MEQQTDGSTSSQDGNTGDMPKVEPVRRGLSFALLRERSYARALRWHPGGIESWSLSDWACAAAGELGEACNVIKKLNRLRDNLPGNKRGEDGDTLREKLALEIADTVMYLDLLAAAAGIDLEQAVIQKFNRVSIVNDFPERLHYERLPHAYDE
jgi:NTP pyrophosphatase (non-canonical NTP hydrolase)